MFNYPSLFNLQRYNNVHLQKSLSKVSSINDSRKPCNNWELFNIYARRIKNLIILPEKEQISPEIWTRIISRPLSTILPNLGSVTIQSLKEIPPTHLSLLFSKRVKKLTIVLTSSDYGTEELGHLYEIVVRCSRSLETLELDYSFTPNEKEKWSKETTIWIGKFTFLKYLRLGLKGPTEINPILLESLSGSPNLLEISRLQTKHWNSPRREANVSNMQTQPDTRHIAKLKQNSFPRLRKLSIAAKLQEVSKLFQSPGCFQRLVELIIDDGYSSSSASLSNLIVTVVNACPLLEVLRIVDMEYTRQRKSTVCTSKDKPIEYDDLLPLQELPRLRVLELKHIQPVKLGDSRFIKLFSFFPNLETLLLNENPLVGNCQMALSLSVVTTLIDNLPKLRNLGVFINGEKISSEKKIDEFKVLRSTNTTKSRFPITSNTNNSNLQNLYLGKTRIPDVAKFIRYLSEYVVSPGCLIHGGDVYLNNRNRATRSQLKMLQSGGKTFMEGELNLNTPKDKTAEERLLRSELYKWDKLKKPESRTKPQAPPSKQLIPKSASKSSTKIGRTSTPVRRSTRILENRQGGSRVVTRSGLSSIVSEGPSKLPTTIPKLDLLASDPSLSSIFSETSHSFITDDDTESAPDSSGDENTFSFSVSTPVVALSFGNETTKSLNVMHGVDDNERTSSYSNPGDQTPKASLSLQSQNQNDLKLGNKPYSLNTVEGQPYTEKSDSDDVTRFLARSMSHDREIDHLRQEIQALLIEKEASDRERQKWVEEKKRMEAEISNLNKGIMALKDLFEEHDDVEEVELMTQECDESESSSSEHINEFATKYELETIRRLEHSIADKENYIITLKASVQAAEQAYLRLEEEMRDNCYI